MIATVITCHIFCNAEQKVPPTFDIPLKPMTVNEDDKLILSCHVRGSPPLKIQWMKDRRELSSSASTKITFVDGKATLEILRVSKNDAGDYLCKAANEAGSEFCKSKVTVKGIHLSEKALHKYSQMYLNMFIFVYMYCTCVYMIISVCTNYTFF